MVIEKDWWDDCASRFIDAFGALAAKCQHVTLLGNSTLKYTPS